MPPVFPEEQHLVQEVQTESGQAHEAILLEAQDSAEAFRQLYQTAKNLDKRYSLSFMCRRLGLSSKGFLSDVMQGKRLLGHKYWDKVGQIFHLDPACHEILILLFSIDNEKDCDRKKLLTDELAIKRKALRYSKKILSSKLRGMFFSFDVFCAFGLFHNEPSKEQLRQYFGVERGVELEVALNILLTTGLIEKTDHGTYRLTDNRIRFSDSEDGISHLDFLRESIEDARRSVETWKTRTDESIFASNIISVKRSDYLAALNKLKRDLLEIQSNLESQEADILIRFNIQVYPT
jgi:uncharacterized protein (TIGR02147 family)